MSVVEWIAVTANIASIIGLWISLKQYNMKAIFLNPYSKVFGASLVFTAFVFLIPWKRIHFDSETPIQKPAVIHDTVIKVVDKSIFKPATIQKSKSEIRGKKNIKIVYLPLKSNLDTTNAGKGSKYMFTAPVSQSAIGDNAAVTNNNYGIKQRHLNDAVLTSLLISMPDKNIPVVFWLNSGKEVLNYGNEIYQAIKQRGYKTIAKTNWLDHDDYDKVYVVFENGEYQIRVCEASNSQ